ncbi:MAG: CaiB/BaiF CoA-transferase family protein [Bacteroidetes bacterium]|nr:CaiB/BaiF CoA-transferase family protein [Bacteroidota bacterium]
MKGIFADLVVLELAGVLAGPSAGQFFAELGARVIKIENPATAGDVTRSWRLPSEAKDGLSAYFYACNWGKESVALDLKTPDGQAAMHALVAKSDIVISNFLPKVAKRLKADYASLQKLNSAIILGSVVGYSSDPDRAGYDAVIQAEAGYYHLNGDPSSSNWQPTKLPVALMDLITAHQLKQALLLALIQKGISGKGSHVTVSIFDSAVSALCNQATNYLVAGHKPVPLGSEHPNISPYGSVYTSSDDQPLVLAVGSDRQFESLCLILGIPELALDLRFKSNADRVLNRAALKALLQSAISTIDRARFLTLCLEHKIPTGAVHQMDEVINAAPEGIMLKNDLGQMTGVREFVAGTELSQLDTWNTKNMATPPPYASSTLNVLSDFLGYSDSKIESLIRSKAVECRSSPPTPKQ